MRCSPVGATTGLEGREHGHKTGRGPFSWALRLGHSSRVKTAARFRITLSMERDLKCSERIRGGLWNAVSAIQ